MMSQGRNTTPGPGPAGGTGTIEMWCVVWGCMFLWQLKDPFISIKKALCPGHRFLSQPNIATNACERAIIPDSINQSKEE